MGKDMNADSIQHTITFERPLIGEIARRGYQAVDMHFHTNHSDSPTQVKDALNRAKKMGVGIAITDHNEISGVIEAYGRRPETLLIPGMEISALDGPHILVYFYTLSELSEFYTRHIQPNKQKSPFLATRLTTEDIVDRIEGYNCVTVAAHPYGYLIFNKGLQKCIDSNYLDPNILSRFDGIEAISGLLRREMNRKAADLAIQQTMGITGGTDGHLLHHLGDVVTCAHADDVEGFLSGITARNNFVVGLERGFLEKAVMGTVVLTKYLKYTVPSLQIHYEQNMPRVKRFVNNLWENVPES
jgi:hypothetical protein